MRSFALCFTVAALAAWVVIRHLPERQAVAGVAHAVPRAGAMVESVALDGDDLPMAALRAALATRAGAPLDDATLARDRAALEAVLVARGYLAARVAPAQVLSDGGAADVTFAVHPGRQFVISHSSVVGASPLDAGVVTLSPGDPVLASRLAEARQALTARLTSRGAAHAVVTTRITPDFAHATATVVFGVGLK